jgi:CBS domain-containing protein
MEAQDIMTKTVLAAREHTTVKDVAARLLADWFNTMPVVDIEGRIKGVITEYDILKALREGRDLAVTLARDIMTPNPVTAREDTSVEELIRIIEENNFFAIPVEKDGFLVGMVARSDIIRTQIEPEFMIGMDY